MLTAEQGSRGICSRALVVRCAHRSCDVLCPTKARPGAGWTDQLIRTDKLTPIQADATAPKAHQTGPHVLKREQRISTPSNSQSCELTFRVLCRTAKGLLGAIPT